MNGEYKFETWDEMVRFYTDVVLLNERTLYLVGPPGSAKSAIGRSIAINQGLKFIDVRASEYDSTDIIGFPCKTSNSKGDRYMDFVPPPWAYEANQQASFIFLDEINRATIEVLNACLQLLSYKTIGTSFKFNDNVYFMAAGNLGVEDGCDVQEMDSATEQRFLKINHSLTFPMWRDSYGEKNVHPWIIEYLENDTDKFLQSNMKDGIITNNVGNPRTWSELSNWLKDKESDWIFDKDLLKKRCSIKPLGKNARTFGFSYVGSAIHEFIKYIEKKEVSNIENVAKGKFKNVKMV